MSFAGEIGTEPREDLSIETGPRSSRGWRWLPLFVGVIVFELTSNAMLGIALACLRFGHADFATAWWLGRRDPLGRRGLACAAFHLAWGFAQVIMISFLAMGLIILLMLVSTVVFHVRLGEILDQLQGAMLTAKMAMVAFLVTSYAAMALALFGRVKVWASATNHRARREDLWPPLPPIATLPETNRVMVVVAFAILFADLAAVLLLGRMVPRGKNGDGLAQAAVLIFLPMMFVNVFMLVPLGSRISARSPELCWIDDPESNLERAA